MSAAPAPPGMSQPSPSDDPSNPVPVPPSHPTRKRLLRCQHVLDVIMSYASRDVQLACLYIKPLHLAAGRALYHTIAINDKNMISVFRGALVGLKYPKAVWKVWVTHAGRGCVCEGCRNWANDIRHTFTVSRTNTNFKAPLLQFVRVLSLGDHRSSLCRLFDLHIPRLIPNLDILRISGKCIGTPTHGKKQDTVRDPKDHGLLAWLRPRRLIFFGIDKQNVVRRPFPEHNGVWSSAIEEVFCILPMERWRFAEFHDVCLHQIPHFPNMKIVLRPAPKRRTPSEIPESQLEQLLLPLLRDGRTKRTKCTIYSVESMLGRNNEVIRLFRSTGSSMDETLEFLWEHLRTCSCWPELDPINGVILKTFDEYETDVADRHPALRACD